MVSFEINIIAYGRGPSGDRISIILKPVRVSEPAVLISASASNKSSSALLNKTNFLIGQQPFGENLIKNVAGFTFLCCEFSISCVQKIDRTTRSPVSEVQFFRRNVLAYQQNIQIAFSYVLKSKLKKSSLRFMCPHFSITKTIMCSKVGFKTYLSVFCTDISQPLSL